MKINILIIGLIALTFAGCKKFVEEDVQNIRTEENMYSDPIFAQGFVLQAYRLIPAYYNNSDLATDDAVPNVVNNEFNQLATGSWTPTNLTLSVWNPSYSAILYVNQFLANSNKVKFANNPEANLLLNYRMRGEAFGLRALHMFYLLRNHAGISQDSQLLGVPIITDFQEPTTADFNQPRATFDACVKQIYMDLDSAEYYLPVEYVDVANTSQIPSQFRAIAGVNIYNQAMGQRFRQLFNGLIAKSFRARTALLASSPAFQHPTNTATWEAAANAAAEIVRYKQSKVSLPNTAGLPVDGYKYYTNAAEITGLSQGTNPPEIIWREVLQTNNTAREASNFPPSLFGSGFTNPTENLVEAFPMSNGYPIGHPSSTFNASSPYSGRDVRLRTYVLYNEHPDLTTLRTGSQSGSENGINVRSTSTRTGYYLRKTLRFDVNLTPGSVAGQNRYTPRIRYTEMYLNYAEAANEAWGPKGTGPNTFSAYDIIKAIRTRAEVGITNNHAYLEECATDKAKMRELIRNERRLELSFEGFRFWDLRRWNVEIAKLNESARGMDVNGSVFTPITVQGRVYQSHMIYGPIPNSEVLKYSNLVQNKGWQ